MGRQWDGKGQHDSWRDLRRKGGEEKVSMFFCKSIPYNDNMCRAMCENKASFFLLKNTQHIAMTI